MGRSSFYDELEIEDMAWDEVKRVFHYPCPCGDRFEITKKQLAAGEDVATCPSCSLIVRVIYDYMDYEHCADDEEETAVAAPPQMVVQPVAAAA